MHPENSPIYATEAPSNGSADALIARIADFAQMLRRAGMRVGTAAVIDALEAVTRIGVRRRDDFYWTLHATLVSRQEDHALYDLMFHAFWVRPVRRGTAIAPERNNAARPGAGARRAREALDEGMHNAPARSRESRAAQISFSAVETLKRKDFAQMSTDEVNAACQAMRGFVLPVDKVRSRRFLPDQKGNRLDGRAMLKSSLRSGGDPIVLRHRSPRLLPPPLVALVDISGSMSAYSRVVLHFLHMLAGSGRRVTSFTFGTRLTNITRALDRRDPDLALAQAADAVPDWSGGTRIGPAIETFNRLWSRRVLGQGAVVLLITDGLERDRIETLAREMERLHKSCRRLIWLNPLLGFGGFAPKAGGIKAMIPHVDDLRPVHSLESLGDLCTALSRPFGQRLARALPGAG